MSEINNQFGLAPLEIVREMSGLEAMRRISSGEFPHPPICETLDFRLTEVGAGKAVFTGKSKWDFYNPFGTVHGGFLATLLDSAMTCAVQSTLEPGRGSTTIEFKVNFVRPVKADTGILRAESNVIAVGKQIGTAEAKLVDENGKLYAHATTTCMIFQI